jgi:uncharacterized OB-fold protein
VSDRPATDRNDDPITARFWEAAGSHELLIQRCRSCRAHQFYPRPVCLKCFSLELEWVAASGLGVVYSQTVVRIAVVNELSPPYVVAVVELDEGVRMTTNLVGQPCQIGDRVRVAWRERPGHVTLPVFEPLETRSKENATC